MLKPILAVLLLLSLGAKLAWSSPAPEPDMRETAKAVADVLRAGGFEARIVDRPREPHVVVKARRGPCRLVAGDYPAHGTLRDLYRDAAARLGTLHFARRGALTRTEPKLAGLLDFYLWREQRRVRIAAPRAPVVVVAATSNCVLGHLPWERAATVPG